VEALVNLFDTSGFMQSVTVKLLVVAMLTAMLFVPLLMVWGLIGERAGRRDDVVREVGAIWGGRQRVGGIALAVPYEIVTEVQSGLPGSTATTTRTAGRVFVLPSTLQIDVRLAPEVRRRSIFSVNLYRATVAATGRFTPPDFTRLGVQPTQVFWAQAALNAAVSDLRGVVDVTSATWGDAAITLEPAGDASPFTSALRAIAPMSSSEDVPFRIEMTIAGTGGLMFLASGAQTAITLHSPWPDPGFTGALLPAVHEISADGFRAEWASNYLSRPFPQAWIDGAATSSMGDKFQASEFGVDLVTTVDHYQQAERAVKYGFLFIVLTFGLFLVWEVIERLRLHPIQYLLVGLALVVFYLLLLSISEHVRFAVAYGVASVATVCLVSGYALRILGGFRPARVIFASMATLYGLLFVLLSLEDLALLVGSVAGFLVIAGVMYLTRGVDWYGSRAVPRT
jgi:inner membrane protein